MLLSHHCLQKNGQKLSKKVDFLVTYHTGSDNMGLETTATFFQIVIVLLERNVDLV